MDYYNINHRPLLTEKSTLREDVLNQVVFEVHPKASRSEIKKAVERVFNVKVEKVNTILMRGKLKRLGRNIGRRPAWKKVYVTLAKGDKIEFFEGV